jgi:hypothetical protein
MCHKIFSMHYSTSKMGPHLHIDTILSTMIINNHTNKPILAFKHALPYNVDANM